MANRYGANKSPEGLSNRRVTIILTDEQLADLDVDLAELSKGLPPGQRASLADVMRFWWRSGRRFKATLLQAQRQVQDERERSRRIEEEARQGTKRLRELERLLGGAETKHDESTTRERQRILRTLTKPAQAERFRAELLDLVAAERAGLPFTARTPLLRQGRDAFGSYASLLEALEGVK